jgi:hypothetical protein
LGGLSIRHFMTTETETVGRCKAAEGSSGKTTALDWAVFGCLAAGGVGIIKALDTDSPSGVLLCLLGSVAAFGMVFYVHLRKP